MNAISPELSDTTLMLAVMISIAIVQVISLFLTFFFRREIKDDFKEVFAELKGYNRSLGNLESLNDRVSALERKVNSCSV